jgi:phosphoribosylglycinamide formyltransferase-1
MLRIAILASGSGTNAERLVEFFRESDLACVKLIATNNPKAGVIPRAEAQNVETLVFDAKTELQQTLSVLVQKADVVLLAGYLRIIPAEWTRAFQGRMLNIHPALLPKFGGKGMYG